jgi:hypothetical protein
MNWVRHRTPDIGGVDATSKRIREASFNGADGREARARQGEASIVVGNGTSSKQRIPKQFGIPNHPACAAAVASHLFLDGAATPPVSGGEFASLTFVHSVYDRTYKTFPEGTLDGEDGEDA